MQPANTELISGESVVFTKDGAPLPEGTQFQLSPALGSMDGPRYTAPNRIWLGRTVNITATLPGDPVPHQAAVTLLAEPFWIGAIGIYNVVAVLLVVWGLAAVWPTAQQPDRLVVSPPAVTLGSGETARFYASLNGIGNANVTWTATSGAITPSGDYVAPTLTPPAAGAAPAPPTSVTITAQLPGAAGATAKALVLISPAGKLILAPATATLNAREEQRFATGDSQSNFVGLTKDDGSLTGGIAATANYKAPDSVSASRLVTVTATASNGRIASAHVFLNGGGHAGSDPQQMRLCWFAALMGALGALVWTIRSFVSYVGSRNFRASWGMYYVLQPVFAAGLALIAYNGFPSLFEGGASCASATCTSIMKVAFYSGLVGLFSDTMMQKLRDVVKVAFGVQDVRSDRMSNTQGQPTQTPATAAGKKEEKSPAANPTGTGTAGTTKT